MKTIKRTLFEVENLYSKEMVDTLLPLLFEIANEKGREGRILGNLSVENSEDKEGFQCVKCMEFVTDQKFESQLKKGEIKLDEGDKGQEKDLPQDSSDQTENKEGEENGKEESVRESETGTAKDEPLDDKG